MNNIHKCITDRKYYGKLLLTLSDERLFFGFSRLYLPTNKFPKESARLVRRALADHEFFALPNEGGYYFCHINPLFAYILQVIRYLVLHCDIVQIDSNIL